MRAQKIISAGITGTTFMTLYSYLMSAWRGKNYKEPLVLGQLLHRLLPGIAKRYCRAAGWSAHYAVGLLFAATYDQIWKNTSIKPTVRNGIILGGFSGILAVVVWKATFRIHPLPPAKDFKRYYGQLVPAHLVFGMFAVLGYKMVSHLTPRSGKVAA